MIIARLARIIAGIIGIIAGFIRIVAELAHLARIVTALVKIRFNMFNKDLMAVVSIIPALITIILHMY